MNSAPAGVSADDHLAAVDGTSSRRVARPVVDDAVDEPADGGQRDAEALDEVGHVEVAGGTEEVQELRLGHRDVDLEELRCVAVGQALHERLVARDDLVDDVGARGSG